ncbi:MAG: glutathione binding-like protein, partial [Proteobacteria bacterium]|nr:glutathione binding-like protein [Pseudomonadota bacterium]
EAFGRGDAAVYPCVAMSASLGFAPDERHPKLRAWFERCAARESVKRTDAEAQEALRRELEAGATAAGKSRQYRDHRLEWMLRTGGFDIVRRGLDDGTIRFQTEFE